MSIAFAPTPPAADRTANGSAAAGPPQSLDVLLVDPDASSRRALESVFSQLGHRVVSTACVADASALLQTFVFDLLICDAALPDGRGRDVIARVPRGLALHSILVTCPSPTAEVDDGPAVEAGFDARLAKPINLCLLQRTACKLMGRPL